MQHLLKSLKNINNEFNLIIEQGKEILNYKNPNYKLINGYSEFLEEFTSEIMFNLNIIKNQAFECNSYKNDIDTDSFNNNIELSSKYKFQFIEKTKTGIMILKPLIDSSDNEISPRNQPTQNSAKIETKQEIPKIIELQKIYNVPVNKIRFNQIDCISDIMPLMHYYKGDTKRSAGIYTCIANNIFVKIPFPNTYDLSRVESKINSIRCKYETVDRCLEIRKRNTNKNDPIRPCNYVHRGERYTKVSHNYRCQDMPSFGNLDTLYDDIKNVSIRDINTMLFYALSDLLLINIWASSVPHDEIVFDKIDTFL